MDAGGGGGRAPAPAVRVRRAGPEDLAALVALERHFADDAYERGQLRHLLTRAHATAWLARDRAERPLGDALVLLRRDETVARLYSLVVAPEARRRGVATALLDAAEADAAARGAVAMRLEVRADNAPAQRLYERRGYRVVGRREGYYHDGRAALRMRRGLAAPD